jgi:hypothetical protein
MPLLCRYPITEIVNFCGMRTATLTAGFVENRLGSSKVSLFDWNMRNLPQFGPAKKTMANLQRGSDMKQDSSTPKTGKRLGSGFNFLLGCFLVLLPWGSPLHAADDCIACHGPGAGLVNSRGKAITVRADALAHSVHKDFKCVDCHAGAAKSGHTAGTAAASCLTCHEDVAAKLSSSVHAALGDPKDSSSCITCHGTHDVVKPAARGAEFCATCHATEVSQYKASIHGRAHAKLNGDAPTCQSCHGPAHQVVAAGDAKSPVRPRPGGEVPVHGGAAR